MVSWNTAGQPTGTVFDLERDGDVLYSATSPWVHTGLGPGSTHTYRVRSRLFACGESPWTDAVSGTTDGGGVGETCENPLPLPNGPWPVRVSGDTLGFADNIPQTPTFCGTYSARATCGNDVVFSLTPSTADQYVVHVERTWWTGENTWYLYVLDGCTDSCAPGFTGSSYAVIRGSGVDTDSTSILAEAGHTYRIIVDGDTSGSDCGNGDYIISIGPCAMLHAPSGLVARALDGSRVAVSWDPSGQPPAPKQFLRRTNPDGSVTSITVSLGVEPPGSYVDTGLTPGATYSYVLRVTNSRCPNVEFDTAPVSVTLPGDPCSGLATPSGLSVGSPTVSSLTVSWLPGSNPEGTVFDVLRTGPLGSKLSSAVALPFVDTGLEAATAYSYQVRSAKVDCAASPTAWSAAAAGATSCQAPAITTQPSSTMACAGQSAAPSFHVTATGAPQPTFQWFKDGVEIPGAIGPTFAIINPNSGDAGSYICVVHNTCGQLTSNPAALTVNPAPDTTVSAPTSVAPGSTGNQASLPDAGAGAAYSWSIQNGTITSGGSTRVATFAAGTSGPILLSGTVTNPTGCASTGYSQVEVSGSGGSCSYSFTPPSATVGAGPGAGSIAVSGTPSGCQGSWSASDSAAWVSLSGSTTGSGSGSWTVNYNYDANPAPPARSAQVSFTGTFPAGSVFTLDQAAPSSGSCLYEQDFTSNPLWTSLAPAYAYWDSAQGNYYANTYDNLDNAYVGYSPQFATYDGTSPLTVEFDVVFESPNWGTYPGVRFTPQAVTAGNFDTNFSFVFLNLYTDSTGNVLYVADTQGHGYTSTNTVVAGLWYHVALAYTGSGKKLDLTISNKATAEVLTDLNAVDFDIAPFQHVAAGYTGAPDYGYAWSPVRVDNIRICGSAANAGFHTLAPCRVVDTRGAAGALGGPKLAAGETRTWPVATGACGVPASAKSIAVNVTAVTPAASGFLTLYPGGTSRPATSTINFKPGQVRANNALVKVASDGQASVVVYNGSPAPVDVILDVTGYFE